MNLFHTLFILIIYGSAAFTLILALVTRLLWRRGKPLQEP